MTETTTKISFNQAWKDFLLVRPFTKGSDVIIDRDAKNVVVNVRAGPFNILIKDAKKYIIDDYSCSDTILAYPLEIVEREIQEKILKKIVGKELTEEKLGQIIGKLDADTKKIDSRLGCANSSQVNQAIKKRDFWEVLFSVHQLIEYRLRKILLYKCSEINSSKQEIIIDLSKQTISENITSFKHLVEIGYLIGALTEIEKLRLFSFNAERDNIAHKLLKNEITDNILEKASIHGVQLLSDLENIFGRIVKKPEMIVMDSFLIREFVD